MGFIRAHSPQDHSGFQFEWGLQFESAFREEYRTRSLQFVNFGLNNASSISFGQLSSLYLLLGVLWAIIYAMLEQLSSGSFQGLSEPLTQGWSTDWLYFSFVTMTTLGYGDITPTSAASRALVTLQAICGQFYLTVLVAWLVGLHIAHTRNESTASKQ